MDIYIYIPIRNGKNCLNVNILRDTYTTIASSELTVCYENWTIWKQFKMGMSIAMLVYQRVIRNWTYIYIFIYTYPYSAMVVNPFLYNVLYGIPNDNRMTVYPIYQSFDNGLSMAHMAHT